MKLKQTQKETDKPYKFLKFLLYIFLGGLILLTFVGLNWAMIFGSINSFILTLSPWNGKIGNLIFGKEMTERLFNSKGRLFTIIYAVILNLFCIYNSIEMWNVKFSIISLFSM